MTANAKQSVRNWLDRRAESYSQEDFPTHADMVTLPFVVVTRAAVLIVEDEGKLRTGFDAWCSMLRNQQVTDTVYTLIDVTELETDLISAQYVTHLLRDATPICAPFSSQATFRRFDDVGIRMASVTTGLKNLSWPITIPRVEGDGETLEWKPDDTAP